MTTPGEGYQRSFSLVYNRMHWYILKMLTKSLIKSLCKTFINRTRANLDILAAAAKIHPWAKTAWKTQDGYRQENWEQPFFAGTQATDRYLELFRACKLKPHLQVMSVLITGPVSNWDGCYSRDSDFICSTGMLALFPGKGQFAITRIPNSSWFLSKLSRFQTGSSLWTVRHTTSPRAQLLPTATSKQRDSWS